VSAQQQFSGREVRRACSVDCLKPWKKHYFVWFATVADPAGAPPSCSTAAVPSLSPIGAALLGGLLLAILMGLGLGALGVRRRA